jgi:large subunit ribosomal protein L18
MRLKKTTLRAKNIYGTAARPRLAVFRSLTHIYAQLIDDVAGKTVASANSLKIGDGKKIEVAALVGTQLAEKAKTVGVEQVVFDRRRRRFHGRVKALADAARASGLKF